MQEKFSSISEGLSVDNVCLLCHTALEPTFPPERTAVVIPHRYEISGNFILLRNDSNTGYSLKINIKDDSVYVYDTDSVNGIWHTKIYTECPNCGNFGRALAIKVDTVNAKILKVRLSALKMIMRKNNEYYCIKNNYSFNETQLFHCPNILDTSISKLLLRIKLIEKIEDPRKLLDKLYGLQLFK